MIPGRHEKHHGPGPKSCLNVTQVKDLIEKITRDNVGAEFVSRQYSCSPEEAHAIVREVHEFNWRRPIEAEEKPNMLDHPVTTRDVVAAAMWELGYVKDVKAKHGI